MNVLFSVVLLKINLLTLLTKGFAKLKKFQKSKNNLEVGGWVQVQFGIKKKLENCPKI